MLNALESASRQTQLTGMEEEREAGHVVSGKERSKDNIEGSYTAQNEKLSHKNTPSQFVVFDSA